MKKLLLTMLLMLTMAGTAVAWSELRPYDAATGEKGLYKPSLWRYDAATGEYSYDGVSYSLSRKAESENFVVYWSSEYGTTAPNELRPSDTYYVDIPDLLQKAEKFYKLYAEELAFVDPTKSTTMSKYKCMICLIHTTTWMAYGGGYDFVIPALWINPATCKPVGHTIAHEIGHSFHYMCFAEASNHNDSRTVGTGFHLPVGNGQGIWEQTAQWQAAQAYPSEMFTQSYPLFGNSANYAFTHEWIRYQSYWFHYYLCQYYNDLTVIGQVWNQPMTGAVDFNQSLMALKGLNAEQLYERYFDYALHCATYDFDAAARYRNNYIGNFDYRAVLIGEGKYQVSYASAPQSTGFNVIELNVPAGGADITTRFTALTPGCPLADGDPGEYNNGNAYTLVSAGVTNYNSVSQAAARGFRLGYVFLKKDGTREYYNDNTIHCTGTDTVTEDITATVPSNVSRIFLVVSPSPSTYIQHQWDENIKNDDQWPYQFQLIGTEATNVIPYIKEPDFEQKLDGRRISNITLTYNVVLPPTAAHDGANIYFTGSSLNALSTAFQLDGDDLFNRIINYNASGPQSGQIMNYAAKADGSFQSVGKGTNGDFGHWFNASGTAVSYGSNCVAFAEFTKLTKSAFVGQYPNANSDGTKRTIREALCYKNENNQTATAYLVFNITFQKGVRPYGYLADIDYDKPEVATATAPIGTSTCVKDITLRVQPGQTTTAALSEDDITALRGALNNAPLAYLSNNMFRGFYYPMADIPATRIYYYALQDQPAADEQGDTQATYYNVPSVLTDTEFDGQYTYYYGETGQLVDNAAEAKIKLAYNHIDKVFTVKATDDCPLATCTAWIGFARKRTAIYLAYFPIKITVGDTPAVSLEDITALIDRYLAGEPNITIQDITALIDEYLAQ
ncbi:MAG: DUF4859 domain-containing protein [Bacteroidaceae bacterium]|nr:DUF4859 domain-containing protein [Bacteroidaceae bacterium]